jgi:phage shock protein PspC (stress-responsive transcriptional regulator)
MKRFVRLKKERKIFGVCGGLALFTNIDPLIWRLIFFGLIFTPFPIITIYLLMALFSIAI